MGTGGPGLFDDDTALDVRDSYRDALQRGLSDAEAEAATLEDFEEELADEDERGMVWLALAVSEWESGRLSSATREQALFYIGQGIKTEAWRDSGVTAELAWAKELERLRAKLEGSQPARKRVRRPKKLATAVHVGDIYSYRLRSGRLALLWVTGHIDMPDCVAPVIHVLEYNGSDIPPQNELVNIAPRDVGGYRWPEVEYLILEKRGESPGDYGLDKVGSRTPVHEVQEMPDTAARWEVLLRDLERRDVPPDFEASY